MFLSIPSPSSDSVSIFGFDLGIKWYGLMIALGVIAGLSLARKRWADRGYDPEEISNLAIFAIPAGLIGTRIYHVITDWNRLYKDDPFPAVFEIWNGGLGIPGGIFLGTVVGLLVARKYKMNIPDGFDAAAPAIPLAQAIGRFGNWFNQELYGGPTDLPWGVEIDLAHRPVNPDEPGEFVNQATYHPTFLYESLWNIGVVLSLLAIDRTKKIKRGKLFPMYVFGYFTGRLWVEAIRIDEATEIFGYRVNTVLSVTMIVLSMVWFFWGGFRRDPDDLTTARSGHAFGEAPAKETDPESAQEGDSSKTPVDSDSTSETASDTEADGDEVDEDEVDEDELDELWDKLEDSVADGGPEGDSPTVKGD